MNLNFINKVYLGITILLAVLIIHKVWAYKSSERFYYYSSVSAPVSFPIHINRIDLILPDNELALGFYKSELEEVNVFMTKWGKEYYFPEVHEPLRLPLKLSLDYCDYRSRTFYKDTIDLPQQVLLAAFKKAVKEEQTIEMYSSQGDKFGLNFVVGIANNGNIVLWLRGKDFEKVIFKKKLHAYEPGAQDLQYERQQFNKQSYLDTVFSELPDSMLTLFKNGYDRSANYIDSPSKYLDLK
ncbi:DUF2931 family protein [Pedobacter sp. GR22-6]|uniref:DUF2931 family protein n=1 Tax=Pedobacter sp. GR22-6 TaxID=3127957 RepID=UPI00307D1121